MIGTVNLTKEVVSYLNLFKRFLFIHYLFDFYFYTFGC